MIATLKGGTDVTIFIAHKDPLAGLIAAEMLALRDVRAPISKAVPAFAGMR